MSGADSISEGKAKNHRPSLSEAQSSRFHRQEKLTDYIIVQTAKKVCEIARLIAIRLPGLLGAIGEGNWGMAMYK